ncbi:MAG: DUF2934 domain-containing protein [Deltaproteobacteria bacterium]|nr:DUF2934 domain-containing protein [Deltaproteobacteria bacterium]
MWEKVLSDDWPGFFCHFNRQNQFLPIRVTLLRNGQTIRTIEQVSLLGLIYRGPDQDRPDAIEVMVPGKSAACPEEPAVSCFTPKSLEFKFGDHKMIVTIRITGYSEDTAVIDVLNGGAEEERSQFGQKLAYSVYEQRRDNPGYDLDDWSVAEQIIQSVSCKYIKG